MSDDTARQAESNPQERAESSKTQIPTNWDTYCLPMGGVEFARMIDPATEKRTFVLESDYVELFHTAHVLEAREQRLRDEISRLRLTNDRQATDITTLQVRLAEMERLLGATLRYINYKASESERHVTAAQTDNFPNQKEDKDG